MHLLTGFEFIFSQPADHGWGFAGDLQKLWDRCPSADEPWRDAAFAALARVTARFFAIYPFMDGNGQLWRLALPVLATRLGLRMRPEWTIARRPYGVEFSLALQRYAENPFILTEPPPPLDGAPRRV